MALSGSAHAVWSEDGSVQTLAQLDMMTTPVNAEESASREVAASMIYMLSGQAQTPINSNVNMLGFGLGSITVQEYAAQLLHVMGYTTEEVIETPILEQAVKNGLCTEKQAAQWDKRFTDQDMAEMTCRALAAPYKDSSVITLGDQLVCEGILDQGAAENAGVSTLNGRLGYQLTELVQIPYHLKAAVLEDGAYMLVNAESGEKMSRSQGDIVASSARENENQYFSIDFDADGTRISGLEQDNEILSLAPELSDNALMTSGSVLAYRDFAFCEEEDGYSIRLLNNSEVVLALRDGEIAAEIYEEGDAAQLWTVEKPSIPDTDSVTERLEQVMQIYPDGTALGGGYSFCGAYQCMGFAREVYSKLFGTVACWDYSGNPKTSADSGKFTKVGQITSFGEAEVRELMSKAQPGDILQTEKPKQHSMVVVSTDENGFTVYDANWAGSNIVDIRYIPYSGMTGQNSANMTLLHSNDYPTK